MPYERIPLDSKLGLYAAKPVKPNEYTATCSNGDSGIESVKTGLALPLRRNSNALDDAGDTLADLITMFAQTTGALLDEFEQSKGESRSFPQKIQNVMDVLIVLRRQVG